MQVNGDSTFGCGRHLLIVSTVCQLQQLLTRKYSAAMGVSCVLAWTVLYFLLWKLFICQLLEVLAKFSLQLIHVFQLSALVYNNVFNYIKSLNIQCVEVGFNPLSVMLGWVHIVSVVVVLLLFIFLSVENRYQHSTVCELFSICLH